MTVSENVKAILLKQIPTIHGGFDQSISISNIRRRSKMLLVNGRKATILLFFCFFVLIVIIMATKPPLRTFSIRRVDL